jgi:GTPase involved in cell partitioning and DNA repair
MAAVPYTGAHKGVGLGRMFLRHLRRTRLLLHVVDGAAADPGTDYLAVREELRLYNPEYAARPHIVALNKVDLEDAGERLRCGRRPSCVFDAVARRFKRSAKKQCGRVHQNLRSVH